MRAKSSIQVSVSHFFFFFSSSIHNQSLHVSLFNYIIDESHFPIVNQFLQRMFPPIKAMDTTIPVAGKNAGYQSEISKLQNILSST